jgi:hypothetical protein
MSTFWQSVRDERRHPLHHVDRRRPAFCAGADAEDISPTALKESLQVLRQYARTLIADQLDEAWSVAYRHFPTPTGPKGHWHLWKNVPRAGRNRTEGHTVLARKLI